MSDERGAAAIVVAVAMTAMLGMAAMVVDVGALYAERRQLQNGADAAALAMAEDCAQNRPECGSSAAAQAWLDANAEDGQSRLVGVDIDPARQEVVVRAGAYDAASGRSGVPMQFASVLGVSRRDVRASASAAWGFASEIPRRANGDDHPTINLAFHACEFDAKTDNGVSFGPATEQPIVFKGEGSCAGMSAPGNFGWLDSTGSCEPVLRAIGPIKGDNGNTPSCAQPHPLYDRVGQEIVLPIFRRATEQGSHVRFDITGYAAFHLTGFRLHSSPGWQHPAGTVCGPSSADLCIRGYFTRIVVPETTPGGENFGVAAVRLRPTNTSNDPDPDEVVTTTTAAPEVTEPEPETEPVLEQEES